MSKNLAKVRNATREMSTGDHGRLVKLAMRWRLAKLASAGVGLSW